MKILHIISTLISLAQALLRAHRQGIKVDEDALSKLTIDDLVQRETFDDVVARKEKERQ